MQMERIERKTQSRSEVGEDSRNGQTRVPSFARMDKAGALSHQFGHQYTKSWSLRIDDVEVPGARNFDEPRRRIISTRQSDGYDVVTVSVDDDPWHLRRTRGVRISVTLRKFQRIASHEFASGVIAQGLVQRRNG